MNASVHLSTEQISDLLAGAVPAAEAMELNAHLASCAACQDVRDDLLDLISLLADEGAAEVVMPTDVAASLDLALREAGSERAARRPASRPVGRQPLRWLAGAAAAVAVVSLGVAGLRALPTAHDNSADDAGAPAHSTRDAIDGQDSAGGSDGSPMSPTLPSAGQSYSYRMTSGSIDPAHVPAVARRLSIQLPVFDRAESSLDLLGCAEPLTGDRFAVVRFEGQRAVLSIDPTTRLVTVYDCATATETLYGPAGY